MMKFLLIAAIYASSSFAESSGPNSCPGGYSDGTRVDKDRYWFECENGEMKPKGCFSEDGRRVDKDSTFDTDKFRMKCLIGSDGFLTIKYQACVHQGSGREIGSQWDDGTAFYTCVQEGISVRVVTLGCVDQGRPLKLDERVAKGDFIYECKKATDGTPRLNKVGCVQDGRKYNIGETFDGPKFWYTCTDSGSKIVGCMHQSNRFQEGGQMTQSDMMFSCKVNGENTEWVPYACLAFENGVSVERKVGCFWLEGDHEYTCKETGSGKMSKVQTQCVYKASQGVLKIRPGCVQLAETIAVGCLDSGSGDLRTETYSADRIDQLSGLRRC